jgi:hypothetical protein
MGDRRGRAGLLGAWLVAGLTACSSTRTAGRDAVSPAMPHVAPVTGDERTAMEPPQGPSSARRVAVAAPVEQETAADPGPCEPTPAEREVFRTVPGPALAPPFDPLSRSSRLRAYRNAYWGFSGSLLPNAGFALEAGAVWRRDPDFTWSWEIEGTYQFLDDKVLVDNDTRPFDDWIQVQAGVKASSHPRTRRNWTGRAGLVYFRANGEPNIVDDEGDYFGLYGGLGFETDLTDCLTMGPELSVMIVTGADTDVVLVPQFNWHVIWSF